jgi:acetamidase/formamidase
LVEPVRATPEDVGWGWCPIDKPPVLTMRSGEVLEMSAYLIMGLDLDRARRNATYDVVQCLVTTYGLRPSQAFSIASVAVDFTISEAVDGVQLVTALVPKALFADSLRARSAARRF